MNNTFHKYSSSLAVLRRKVKAATTLRAFMANINADVDSFIHSFMYVYVLRI